MPARGRKGPGSGGGGGVLLRFCARLARQPARSCLRVAHFCAAFPFGDRKYEKVAIPIPIRQRIINVFASVRVVTRGGKETTFERRARVWSRRAERRNNRRTRARALPREKTGFRYYYYYYYYYRCDLYRNYYKPFRRKFFVARRNNAVNVSFSDRNAENERNSVTLAVRTRYRLNPISCAKAVPELWVRSDKGLHGKIGATLRCGGGGACPFFRKNTRNEHIVVQSTRSYRYTRDLEKKKKVAMVKRDRFFIGCTLYEVIYSHEQKKKTKSVHGNSDYGNQLRTIFRI